jgi:hypothetical protein
MISKLDNLLVPGLVAVVLACGSILCMADEKTEAVPGVPFPIGETLRYQIVWGVMPVGVSDATTEWVEMDGRKLIAIRIRARSNSVIQKIYPVDTFLETLIDPETLLPVLFTKNSLEGKRRMHEVTRFDYAAGVARQHNVRKDRHTEFAIEAGTRDLVSFMYFLRGTVFEKGIETKHRVMADEKVYDLVIRAVKEEKVETGGDKRVSSMKLEPVASFDGLFVRKGRMWLWVSRTVPMSILRAEVEVPLARVKLILDPEAK